MERAGGERRTGQKSLLAYVCTDGTDVFSPFQDFFSSPDFLVLFVQVSEVIYGSEGFCLRMMQLVIFDICEGSFFICKGFFKKKNFNLNK